jgi:hypothetical protein
MYVIKNPICRLTATSLDFIEAVFSSADITILDGLNGWMVFIIYMAVTILGDC